MRHSVSHSFNPIFGFNFERRTGHQCRRRLDRGFSLIEALIATTLFSIMMLGTLPMFIKSTFDVSRNRNLMHYNGAVQAVMDELTVQRLLYGTAGPMLPANDTWRVYNRSNYDTGGTMPANSPLSLRELFSGLGTAGSKTFMNNQLAQIQIYRLDEFGSTRITVELYYYKGKPLPTTVPGSTRFDPFPSDPPQYMSRLAMTSYVK